MRIRRGKFVLFFAALICASGNLLPPAWGGDGAFVGLAHAADSSISGGLGSGGNALGAGSGNSGDVSADNVIGETSQPNPSERTVDLALPIPASSDGATGSDASGSAPSNPTDTLQPQGEIAPALSTITTEPISTPAPTGAPEKASTPDVRGTGNLTHNIDITVPGFRGLEPKIVLNYNSARKTKVSGLYQGWLGYGWGLNGLHVIERGSLGYGVPAFDSSDVYLLNGEQLVNCSAGVVSPSCATGGTHATEIESYNRIAFNSSANEWRVTERDGTVSLFKPVQSYSGATPTAGTPAYDLQRNFRWLLASVMDTNGNSVKYNYNCDHAPVCYPSTIEYNGSKISFYYESRPDHLLMANGHTISSTIRRIKSIATWTGAA
ncbi:hypothetical protein FHS76_004167 [Ochrobactrum daejeonense]|uniref:Uncharacterized protein n=1 Tax=Brucella daejeonensis TaxID=659015 RepID=A0A7W9EPK8_9HYPH|nr:SpvB/TcaC N-terminal domain-containing protein [Brucella daejeonensis]MBB5704250.1 hypothetical protein [Brucella daejeonensis]